VTLFPRDQTALGPYERPDAVVARRRRSSEVRSSLQSRVFNRTVGRIHDRRRLTVPPGMPTRVRGRMDYWALWQVLHNYTGNRRRCPRRCDHRIAPGCGLERVRCANGYCVVDVDANITARVSIASNPGPVPLLPRKRRRGGNSIRGSLRNASVKKYPTLATTRRVVIY